MSALARTALRLSVVSALNADPTIGTMVRGCVYDSRITDLDSQEPVPVIVVFTEDENGDQFSRNNGGPPFNSSVDLILEISIKAVQPAVDDQGAPVSGAVDLVVPYTDAEMEASLDLLEERAIDAITIADTSQSRVIRQDVTRRVSKMRSSRFVLNGAGDKLATRMLSLTVELKNPEPDDPLACIAEGPFAALPDPLRAVCSSLDPASPEYATCKAVAARWNAPTPPPSPAISGIDLTFQQGQLSSHANPFAGPESAVAEAFADASQSPLIKQDIDL